MNQQHCLSALQPGQWARVRALLNEGGIRRRLLDIGLIENTMVKCLGKSPFGDPCAYLIRGAVIAIREEDSKKILIEFCPKGRPL